MLTDIPWTSFRRGLLELLFWIIFPIYCLNDELLIPFHVDESLLTLNEPKPIVYYTKPTDNAPQIMMDAMKSMDRIVIWRDFIKDSGDLLSKYQDDQYVYENFDTEEVFDFYANYSIHQYASLKLGDAMRRANETGDLYLGFNYVLARNNPEFAQAIYNSIAHHGEEFAKATKLDKALHHAFLYYGNRFSSAQHNAPVSDWFVQIANTKTWRFVTPSYTPYFRPMQGGFTGVTMISGFGFLPNDTRIPYVDVQTRPGDLMFFPPTWWHEVHNVHPNAFGLAIGFRPKKSTFPFKWLLLPWTAPKGQIMHKLAIIPNVLFNIPNIVLGGKTRSGVQARQKRGTGRLKKMKRLFPDFAVEKREIKHENILSKPHNAKDVEGWRETLAEMLKTEL